jgi:ferredoxin-NADP reductase
LPTTFPPNYSGLVPLRVRSITWEAEGVLSVQLERPDGGLLPAWAPGSHIDVQWRRDLERQYSLCGPLADRNRWRLAVLKEANGRGGSAYVHDRLRPGELVQVRGPRNHFGLATADEYLFIAGGIGITPLLPMIAEAAHAGRRWHLMYGGRKRASMAFLDELKPHGANVSVRPEDESGLLPLDTFLARPRPNTLVYCCGPEPLLAAAETRCRNWPSGSFHCERFAPKPVEPGQQTDREIALYLHRSGLQVTVPPGVSILEMLRQAGVGPPFSCEEGTCGTCETTILEGTADHRDSLLTEAEREAGKTMMICVSRAISDRLVLDM